MRASSVEAEFPCAAFVSNMFVGLCRRISGAAIHAATAQSSHFETNRNPVLTALNEDAFSARER
jgi:hypothetical protein